MRSLFVSEKEFTACMCTRKNSEIFVTRGRRQLSSPCNVSMYPLPRLDGSEGFGIDWSWTISIPLFHCHIQGTGLLQVLCIFQLNSVLVHFRCVESYIRFFMLIQLDDIDDKLLVALLFCQHLQISFRDIVGRT